MNVLIWSLLVPAPEFLFPFPTAEERVPKPMLRQDLQIRRINVEYSFLLLLLVIFYFCRWKLTCVPTNKKHLCSRDLVVVIIISIATELSLVLAPLVVVSGTLKPAAAFRPQSDELDPGCNDDAGRHWEAGDRVASVFYQGFVVVFLCESSSWSEEDRYDKVVSVPTVGPHKHSCSARTDNFEGGGSVTKTYDAEDKVAMQKESKDGGLLIQIYQCKYKHDVTNWELQETLPAASVST